MSDLDSVTAILRRFYRLVGTRSADPELRRRDEELDEVAYTYLTLGSRSAQFFMLDAGYHGWRKRSSALSFSGTDESDGGRYVDLPSDFLRAFGSKRINSSSLVEPDGTPWGSEIDARDDHLRGDMYYFRGIGDQLWLARGAKPPETLYLDYHYRHPEWDENVTIDFPLLIRDLIPTYAATKAMDDNWLPGGQDYELKIDRARKRAEVDARKLARPSKEPRRFKPPTRIGNRY